MRKYLASFMLTALLPTGAWADISLYGRAHLSLDYLDNGADYSDISLSSNGSRLGFKADHQLGEVKVFMQVEQQVDFDDGDAFTSKRNTFVGLQGNFGTFKVGHYDTPFKEARGPANFFSDELGDLRNLTRVGNARFDERNNYTLGYSSPKLGKMQLHLAHSLGEDSAGDEDVDDSMTSLAVTYDSDLLEAALAYETYDEDHSRGERDGIRLAVGYKLTSYLTLVGFAQSVEHEVEPGLDSEVLGVGADYALTDKTQLRGHYFVRSADAEESDSTMLTVGLVHKFDDQLSFYTNIARVGNDDNIALRPYNQTRNYDIAAVPGEATSGISLGAIYKF